jgi:outer membrane receptor protein involved in Fe transport
MPSNLYAQGSYFSGSPLPVTSEFQDTGISNVTLIFQHAPLREALAEFSKQTGIVLVYSMSEAELERPISAAVLYRSPLTALQAILEGTDLEIMLSASGRVVLIPKTASHTIHGALSGIVVDFLTGDPIPRVNIYVEELRMGTVSNDDGYFRMQNVPAGRYTLKATHIGYETAKRELSVTANEADFKPLSLNPAVFHLGDIYIDDVSRSVHEGGMAVSGTSIDGDDTAMPGRTGVGPVLRSRVAGITFFEYGSGSGSGHLQFRGVGSFHNPTDYMRINVDGIPVDGLYWETFVTDNISRIEVLRGPQASGQYGTNAMSGVINLYTDTGAEGTPSARLSAAGGLAKSRGRDFNPLWQEYFASVGGGSDVITSGVTLRHTRDEGILVNRESRLTAVTAGMEISPTKKITIRGSIRLSDLTSGWPYSQNIQPFTEITVLSPDISSRMQRSIGSMNVHLDLFDWWHQRITVGSEYMYGRMEYDTDDAFPANGSRDFNGRSGTIHERDMHIRPTIHYNSKFIIPIGDHEHGVFSAGIEVQREDRTRDIHLENEQERDRLFTGTSLQTTIGRYLSWSFRSSEILDITVGFRMEEMRAEGKSFAYPVSPSLNIGYRFDIADSWIGVLRSSVGRGIRYPHYSMIFGRPPVEIPNPDLGAEIMDGWEIGLSNYTFDGKLSFTATYFDQETKNAFQPLARSVEPAAYQWVNGGRVSNKGLELEASATPAPWMQAGVSHIFHWNRAIDLRQEDPHEYTLLRVPDIAGSFFLAVNPLRKLNVHFDMYYVGVRLDLDVQQWHDEGRAKHINDYETIFPGYVKVDVIGQYVLFDNQTIFINVYNLFNDMTREYGGMPTAGRMVIVGYRYTI